FINPPYAEHGNKRSIRNANNSAKIAVAQDYNTYREYSSEFGTSMRELFAQFFVRIYKEIPNCILGSFSTPKHINSQNFSKFRQLFKAKFLKGFAVPSYTFDNVPGAFPICFLVWDLGNKKDIKKIRVQIFDENNKKICKKNFYVENKFISAWLRKFYDKNNENLAWLILPGVDMQIQNGIYITKQPTQSDIKQHKLAQITKYNLIPFCVYFAVRHAIKASWINNKDQFLFPKNKWRQDTEFHNDCLAFALFFGQNKITSKDGINHFIPFSEQEVGAKEAFQSDFMVRFMEGKVKNGTLLDCFVPNEKMTFSSEAKAVFSAGLELWRYYHAQAKSSEKYLNDASLYDIKEYFQGRSESKNGKQGKLNAKSEDSHYNDLLANLRLALNDLATKIQPKIYEYEFLLE
ncbi:hypothetical protein ACWIUO_06505, partial [Helicobacter sp. T3_23-1056]